MVNARDGNVELSDSFNDSAAALGLICAAIKLGNLKVFRRLLPMIEDLEAEGGRIMRSCVEHDRYTIAKEVFLSGGVTVNAMLALKAELGVATAAYQKLPSGKDQAEREELMRVQTLCSRLEAWQASFQEEIMPMATLKKIDSLEQQVADLRREIAEVIAPARNVISKSTPATP